MIPLNFLFLTLCIISLSIYLIHKLTNFFGLQLKYKALALCALLAMIVNCVTILLSPYLTTRYFILLLGLTLTAAFLVTCYNESLLRTGHATRIDAKPDGIAENLPSETSSAIPDEVCEELPPIVTTDPDLAVVHTAARTTIDQIPIKKITVRHPIVLPPWHTMPRLCAYISDHQLPAASTDWPLQPWLIAIAHKDPAIDRRMRPSCSILQRLLDQVPARIPQRVFHAPALLQRTVAEIVREDIENDRLLKLTVVIAKLVSLDDILNYAYEQRERHNSFNALFAYKKALLRYRSDSYAPFIAIDIINIYKENGAYHEAAHTCYDALTLPAVQANFNIQKEIQRSLIYLRAIEFVLTRHHLLKTPFNRIPHIYLEEIETVFQNRYMKKNHIKGRLQKNRSQADTQPLLSRLD